MRALLVFSLLTVGGSAHADTALPTPLRVDDVVAQARARRSEIVAARARARAAGERPAIVSALDEPIVSVSVDHLPFGLMGADASLAIEQAVPLSRIRGHRKRAAEASARGERAAIDRARLDVELEAARAFWMLAQMREEAVIVQRQQALAKQLEAAALARYSSNTGTQADVLRAQIEVANVSAERRSIAAEVRGAEIMLNTTLARDPDASVPPLDTRVSDALPPAAAVIARASRSRPELAMGRAEVEQAEAEVRVMRSMYAPMAMLRTGPAYTMAEGKGWMFMVGLTIPLWRGKLRAGVAEANAMVDMASADLEVMRRMAEGEALSAREQVAAARERYVALRDDVVARAEQAIAPTLAAYSAGQVPLVSVVEAVQSSWMAQRELVAARATLGTAWARLRRAAGKEVSP